MLPDWGVGGCDDEEDEDGDGVDVADGGRLSLGFRGGPCGGGTAAGAAESTSEEENHNGRSSSLEAKYFSRSFQHEQEESDDDWNHCPGNLEAEFKQGGSQVTSGSEGPLEVHFKWPMRSYPSCPSVDAVLND